MKKEQIYKTFVGFILISILMFSASANCTEVLDRIVAIVNNHIILLSEYEEKLQTARNTDAGVSEVRVLNEMISRILLLEQAKRLRLGSYGPGSEETDDDTLVMEYTERRIRSFIHIPIEDMESYYSQNRAQFEKREFYDVKDEIENYLVGIELENKLLIHIEELRKKAYIRVQLQE